MIETAANMKNVATSAEFDKYQKLRAFVAQGIRKAAENGEYSFCFDSEQYRGSFVERVKEELAVHGYEVHQEGWSVYVYWR